MNTTVGWQYTLRSVMFNAPAETEMAALQMMSPANISLVNLLNTFKVISGANDMTLLK